MPPITRGRPRSETARRDILEATSTLILERGFEPFTLAEVAIRAGVGKQTVYRWWPTKASLVADCVLEGILPIEADLVTADADPASALRTWLSTSAGRLSQPEQAALFRALNAAAASDDTARAKLTERFHDPLVAAMVATLDSGVRSGTFRGDLSSAVVAEMIISTMSYALMRPDGLNGSWVDDVMGVLLDGITPRD